MNYFDGLQLIRAQDSPRNQRMFDMHFRDYYGLQYNHHGPLVFARGDESLREYNGSYAFITSPGIRFRYGTTPDRPRHHCYVCFKGPRVSQLIKSHLLPINTVPALIRISDPEEFYLSFMDLLKAFQQNQPSIPRCVNILEGLLLQIYESSRTTRYRTDALTDQVQRIGQDITKHPRRQWDFKESARQMNISYAHFRRRFAEVHAIPPGRFLLNARLDQAAQLLTSSDLSITLISEKIGIDDIYHFSKLFKRKFHLPPGKYRNEFGEHIS